MTIQEVVAGWGENPQVLNLIAYFRREQHPDYTCKVCGKLQVMDDDAVGMYAYTIVGKRREAPDLCSECAEQIRRCGHCSKIYVADMDNFSPYCPTCNIESEVCDACQATVKPFHVHTIMIGDDDARLCSRCYGATYHCDDCGTNHFNQTSINQINIQHPEREFAPWVFDFTDEPSCDEWSMYCSNCSGGNRIMNYMYAPQPVFKRANRDTSDLYFGVEIEVEVDGSTREKAELVDCEHVYLKYDASINNGFEIVSHPFTYNWLKENTAYWANILRLRTKGFKSYSTDTCGMHIHMSRDAFTSLHMFKFMKMWYDFPVFTHWMSRRKKEHLEYWAGVNQNENNIKRKAITKQQDGNRHVAVAMGQHGPTIEVRVFRGTLGMDAFMANIECCKALYDYTLQSSMNVNPDDFFEYTLRNAKFYPSFAKFVTKRRGRYYSMLRRAKKKGEDKPSRNGSKAKPQARRQRRPGSPGEPFLVDWGECGSFIDTGGGVRMVRPPSISPSGTDDAESECNCPSCRHERGESGA